MATTDNIISLKTLLVPSKATEIEYPGLPEFKLEVVFLARESLISIRKQATKVTFKNRQPVEELDDKVFLEQYVKACIKGWKGLKLSYLEQLAPVDLTGQNPEAELAYSQDNALFLMQNSANFDAFISDTVTDLSNFTKSSSSK